MDHALEQSTEKSWKGLHKVWEDLQFRVRDGTHVEAPFRMNFLALRTFWLKHALVGCEKGVLRCTCLMAAQHGHCIHQYIVKKVHAKMKPKNQEYGFAWHPAKTGAVALQSARSSSSSSSSSANDREGSESNDEELLSFGHHKRRRLAPKRKAQKVEQRKKRRR